MADDTADAADWLRHAVASGAIQVAKLEAEIERLRDAMLTDEEREQVSVVADWAAEHLGQDDPGVVALRALMERLP